MRKKKRTKYVHAAVERTQDTCPVFYQAFNNCHKKDTFPLLKYLLTNL